MKMHLKVLCKLLESIENSVTIHILQSYVANKNASPCFLLKEFWFSQLGKCFGTNIRISLWNDMTDGSSSLPASHFAAPSLRHPCCLNQFSSDHPIRQLKGLPHHSALSNDWGAGCAERVSWWSGDQEPHRGHPEARSRTAGFKKWIQSGMWLWQLKNWLLNVLACYEPISLATL